MANVKITDLSAYTNPAATDVLPIVDVAADVTKKVSIQDLLENAGSGTAAAPGIAFDGDSDTGIYRPGANQLALSTSGVQRINIEADGDINIDNGGVFYDATNNRLAIGTASPGERLSLNEGTALGWNDSSGNNAARIYATSGDELRFERGSTNSRSMTIDSSGRLLVGTGSDSGGALLQVNDNRIRVATAKTPASASDTGTTGEICWDASYVYVCTATNTWKRAALATW